MPQPRGMPAGRVSRPRQGGGWAPQPKFPPKLILCLLPRRMQTNPVAPLLRGYELAVADTSAQVLRLARRQVFDLYVVFTPLGWIASAEACRKIRRFDPHTPLIVYTMQHSSGERREVMAAGAQAYIARSDDEHNLSATAGQLIMLTELRSMEAMSSGGAVIRDQLVSRLARLRRSSGAEQLVVQPASQAQLKVEARRLFAQAGGSRANFERLWPSIYEGALKRFSQSASEAL